MTPTRRNTTRWAVVASLPALALVGCGDDGATEGAEGDTLSLTLAHSYNEDQPQARCGAEVIKEETEAADVGLEIEVFGSSQLGGDADRIASVASGDIDIDIQGASALGAVHEPVSVLDAAYVFDDAEHLERFMDSAEGEQVTQDFAESADIHTLGAWSAGARHFTADEPIRSPEDLEGLRIRFPGSPQYLTNARALGAEATEVAYEELYLSLQQGAVDGQENPITNIDSENLAEVQDYLSVSSHQLNTNLIIMSEAWTTLSEDQQSALTEAVESAVTQVTDCVTEDEEATLEQWRTGDDWEVVEDVDVDAFRDQSLQYLEENLQGDSLEVFEAVRATTE